METPGTRYAKWVANASPHEVLSLAIRMEQGAVRTYRSMAKQASSAPSRAKFRYLAAEEREHARILAEARKRTSRPSGPRLAPPPMSEVESDVEDLTPTEAVRLAIRSEHDAEAFYRLCAKRCRSAKSRRMFETLAKQESGHAKALESELKALQGPLPWSSLEGFVPEEKDYWTV